MPTITLKNIPDDLYETLRETARRHHRSLNSEIIHCIERTVKPQRIDPDTFLTEIAALRGRVKGPITADAIDNAKQSGRP